MTNPFSKRTLAIIIVVALVSLGAAAALTIMGDDLNESAPSASVS